jgi:hypothetical protein
MDFLPKPCIHVPCALSFTVSSDLRKMSAARGDISSWKINRHKYRRPVSLAGTRGKL